MDNKFKNTNEFEKFPELSIHIERMASTGTTGNIYEWSNFIDELNGALSEAKKPTV